MTSQQQINNYHHQFHQLLGHLSTIRAAIWEIQQQTEYTSDLTEAAKVAQEHAAKMVPELETLRDEINQYIKST